MSYTNTVPRPPEYESLMGAVNFQFLEPIGGRSFGTTNRARNKKNGLFVAVKTVPCFFIERRLSNVGILSFVYQLSKMFHPAIATIHGVIFPDRECTSHYRFVGEFYEKGSLADLYQTFPLNKSPDFWNSTRKSVITFGIAAGMQFLYHSGYTHGYLSPSSVVFDKNMNPHINDFWYSVFNPEGSHKFISGPYSLYSAPERFKLETGLSTKVDVFSFGIILYEIAFEKPIIENEKITQQQILSLVYSGVIKSPLVSDKLQNLIFKCLSIDPKERPSFDFIIASFMDDHDPLFPDTNVTLFDEYRSLVIKDHIQQMSHVDLFDTGDILAIPQNANFIKNYAETYDNPKTYFHYGMLVNDISFIKLSADKGCKSAQYLYAIRIEESDKEEALKYLKMSADQNYVKALKKLADVTKQDEYLKKAADLGSSSAQVKYALKSNELYYLKMAADKHNSEALFLLAQREETGQIIKFDKTNKTEKPLSKRFKHEKAVKVLGEKSSKIIYKNLHLAVSHYSEAAELNHFDAISRLEAISTNGVKMVSKCDTIFKQKDPKKVDELIMYAMMILAGCFNVERNVPEACRILNLAALLTSSPDAEFQLYELYNRTDVKTDTPKDAKDAIKYLKLAADQGHLQASMHYAEYLFTESHYSLQRQNHKDTIKYFKHAANMGDIEAMIAYANFIQTINDIEYALQESAIYYKLAADRGCLAAQFHYGQLSEMGAGVPQSIETALYYYKLAAKQGFSCAMLAIAQLYEQHKDLNINAREITKRYLIAGSNGEAHAMFVAGERYSTGEGVPADIQRAILYYQIAAVLGDMSAQYKYGHFLAFSHLNNEEYVNEGIHFLLLAFEQSSVLLDFNPTTSRIHTARSLALLYMNKDLKIYSPKEALMWLEEAVNQGDFESFVYIGDINEEKGMFEKAFHAYSAGRQELVAKCYPKLAKYYEEGIACEKDIKQAAELYEMAGLSNPRYYLKAAQLYDQLNDKSKDFANMLYALYSKAIVADDDNYTAHFRVAQLLMLKDNNCEKEDWLDTSKEAKLCKSLFVEAANNNNVDAALALKKYFGDIRNNRITEKCLRNAAKLGHPKAQVSLADSLKTCDTAKAMKLYRAAMQKNDPDAYLRLSYCYERGNGVPQHRSHAIHLSLLADNYQDKKKGRKNAMRLTRAQPNRFYRNLIENIEKSPFKTNNLEQNKSEICKILFKNDDRETDVSDRYSKEVFDIYNQILHNYNDCEKFIEKLRKMAVRGNGEAQDILGWLYLGNEVVVRNEELAVKYLRMATNHEKVVNSDSLIQLSKIFSYRKNLEVAMNLLERAKKLGNKFATSAKLGLLFDNDIDRSFANICQRLIDKDFKLKKLDSDDIQMIFDCNRKGDDDHYRLVNIGNIAAKGLVGKEHVEAGANLLREAADKNDADGDSIFIYAKYLLEKKNDRAAAEHYLELAVNQKCIPAIRLIAKLNEKKAPEIYTYYNLIGCEIGDRLSMYRRAIELIKLQKSKEAKDLLNVVACTNGTAALLLGSLYEIGTNELKKNFKKAIEYYYAAGSLGVHVAYFKISNIYKNGGFGVQRDIAKATETYENANREYKKKKMSIERKCNNFLFSLQNDVIPLEEFLNVDENEFEIIN